MELPIKDGLYWDGLYWYTKKIKAEHAAARRALDCVLLREGGNLDGCCFGESKPYWPSQQPTLPLNKIPAQILEGLQKKDQWKTNNNSMLSLKDSNIKDNDLDFTNAKMTVSITPKAALYEWYGKKTRKIQPLAEKFVTWDNGKMDQQQLYTSIFKDPTTNEAFLAGPWSDTAGEGNMELPNKDGLYWFRKKSKAEHAAAARALDCLQLREGGNLDSCCFGEAKPYWPSQQPTLPLNEIPAHILERLQNFDQWKTNNGASMSFDDRVARLTSAISVPTKKKKIEKEKVENNNKDDENGLSRDVFDEDDKDYYYIPYEG